MTTSRLGRLVETVIKLQYRRYAFFSRWKFIRGLLTKKTPRIASRGFVASIGFGSMRLGGRQLGVRLQANESIECQPIAQLRQLGFLRP